MIQSINFNPYAFQTAPKVHGLTAASFKQTQFEVFRGTLYCPVEEQQLKSEMAPLGIHVVTRAEIMANMSPTVKLNELLSNVFSSPNDPLLQWQSAMSAKLGQMHNARFFDYGNVSGKLARLRNIAETVDYSGMSETEKVLAIYNRYDQAFGNFRMASAIGYPALAGERTDSEMIMRQFNDELTSVFGSVERAREAYRVAQYGNMSNAEIREAISTKYPPANEMTLREFHEMVWEMFHVGADDGLMSVLSTATDRMGVLAREELLDRPLDLRWLSNSYNTLRSSMTNHFRDAVRNTGSVLRDLFGMDFDARGNAISHQRSSVDYEALIRQLTNRFFNTWTAKDYENWLQSQFQKEYDEWLTGMGWA